MKAELAEKEIKEFIDGNIELFSEGQYAVTDLKRAKIIAEYIKNKITFVEAGTEDLNPLSGHLVYYSDDELMISTQMKIEDMQSEVLKRILLLSLIELDKMDDITMCSVGFLSVLFIEKNASIGCVSIINKEINTIALSVYARFYNAYKQKKCNSLDDFINQGLLKHNDSKEYNFMLLSHVIGNDLVLESFKTSSVRRIDEYTKKKGISFEDISNSFKKDYNLEFIRAIIYRLKNSNVSDNVTKILTREVFEEILERLKRWFTIGFVETEADDVKMIATEYFFEGFENRFGTEIDVDKEVEEIIRFYSEYFGDGSSAKMNFFKNYTYWKKYRMLKNKSYDLAVESLNNKESSPDIAEDAKKILMEVEKLNKQVEKEPGGIQQIHVEDAKEVLINCMSAPTGEKTVLGREIGELAEIFSMLKPKSNEMKR